MNTLIIDCILIKKKKKIPQSSKNFFDIKKSEIWHNSIELSFDILNETDILNLYLIFRSYIVNSIVPCIQLCIAWKDYNDKFIIVENVQLYRFKNIHLKEFISWYEWRINEGLNKSSQQKRVDEIMYFIFSFESKIIELKKIKIEDLYPNFPWNEDLLRELKFYSLEYKDYKNEIKLLKKKIEVLEHKLSIAKRNND